MRLVDNIRIVLSLIVVVAQFVFALWPVITIGAVAYGFSYLTDNNIIWSVTLVTSYIGRLFGFDFNVDPEMVGGVDKSQLLQE